MIVLMLQSFLPVCIVSTFLSCESASIKCVRSVSAFLSSLSIRVHLCVPVASTYDTMAEAVIAHSLGLMETYQSVSMSSSTVQWLSVAVPFNQPVSGVINKDCTEPECLYSSSTGASVEMLTCESTDLLWRYWSSQWAPHTSPTPHNIILWNSSLHVDPVHILINMNNCCCPLRLKN